MLTKTLTCGEKYSMLGTLNIAGYACRACAHRQRSGDGPSPPFGSITFWLNAAVRLDGVSRRAHENERKVGGEIMRGGMNL